MKVHFASGPHTFGKPWVNVDHYLPADYDVDLLEPFPDFLKKIEWAYVGHFLEHITVEEGITFLSRVLERMTPEGQIMIIGPDYDKGQQLFKERKISRQIWEAIQPHGDAIENDRRGCHLWECTGSAVVSQLFEAGWYDSKEFPIGNLPKDYPDIPVIDLSAWQFAVTAKAGCL